LFHRNPVNAHNEFADKYKEADFVTAQFPSERTGSGTMVRPSTQESRVALISMVAWATLGMLADTFSGPLSTDEFISELCSLVSTSRQDEANSEMDGDGPATLKCATWPCPLLSSKSTSSRPARTRAVQCADLLLHGVENCAAESADSPRPLAGAGLSERLRRLQC
jgi:hypothetical protein